MNTYVIEIAKQGRWVYYATVTARDDQQAFVMAFGSGLRNIPREIRVRKEADTWLEAVDRNREVHG